MSRRHRKNLQLSRICDSLVVLNVTPTVGVVERIASGTAQAREVAQAKRTVADALRDLGIPKSKREHIVAVMPHAELLAEAARLHAAAEPASPEPAQARPWWRRMFGGAA